MTIIAPGGLGISYRTGIIPTILFEMFPNNRIAEKWVEKECQGKQGPECPRCESRHLVRETLNQKPSA